MRLRRYYIIIIIIIIYTIDVMGICNNFVLCRILTTHEGIHIIIFLFSFNAKHKHTGTKRLINNIIQAGC